MHYLETPQEKEMRAREQTNLDEDRKEKKKDFDRWQEKFAVDFAKGMECIYQLVSQTIITDLDRTLEQLTPVTRDPEIQFFAIFRRLEDKWGPTSKKDAVEIVRLIHALQGDFRGWDIYLVGLDSLVETLTKTPVRDAANNPMFIPVPNRPHLPRPHPHSTLAEYRAHFAADAAAQLAWEQQHPADKVMNHRPTDEAIKEIVIIALAESQFIPYSTLAQRYQQTDHATRTWLELRRDVESLTQNSARGTSRDPSSLLRPNSIHISSAHQDNQHLRRHHDRSFDQRSARSSSLDYNHFDPQFDPPHSHYHSPHQLPHHSSKRSHDHTTNDIRAATQPPKSPSTTTKFPCANCGGDHRSAACDSTLCAICQGTFPTAALRHAHYETAHRKDTLNKRTRFADPSPNRNHYTPPTSPFLQSRSARSSDGYASHSSYDSGNDSTYSTASGPGMPPTCANAHHDAADSHLQQVFYDCRVAEQVFYNPTAAPPPTSTAPPDIQPTPTDNLLGHAPPTQTHQGQQDITYYLDDIIEFQNATANRIEHYRYPNLAAPTHILYRNGQSPILIRNPPAVDSDSDELPDLIDISDDERNRLDREGPHLRAPLPPPGTYDIRVIRDVTHSDDDQQTDSDDEAEPVAHDPATWYDHTLPHLPLHDRNLTQPLTTPPFLSTIEIHQWYRSQMRWRQFLLTLPERHQAAYERRPAPDIRMQEPNRPFMLALPATHPSRHVDSLDIRARLLDFDSQEPPLPWSTYLRTLHPPTTTYYRSFPPLHGDSIANSSIHGRDQWPPQQPSPPANTAAPPTTSLKDPAIPHPADPRTRETTTNSNPPSSNPHIAGRWYYGRSNRTDVHSLPRSQSAQKGNYPAEGYPTETRDPSPPVQKGNLPEGYSTAPRPSSPPAQKGTRPDEYPAHHAHIAPINRTRTNPSRVILPIRSSLRETQDRRDSNMRYAHRHTTNPGRSRPRQPTPSPPPDLQTDSSSDDSNPSPPQSKRQCKSSKHPTHGQGTSSPTMHPNSSDQPGNPWCTCCTTVLCDDDQPEPALCDEHNPGTRYRIRQQHHNPSHSTLHLSMLRIFSDNYQHHEAQRRDRERILILPHQLPRFEPSTSFSNNRDFSNLLTTLQDSQYQREADGKTNVSIPTTTVKTAPTTETCALATPIAHGSMPVSPVPTTHSGKPT